MGQVKFSVLFMVKKLDQKSFLDMKPVFGLIKNDGTRPVHDLRAYLLSTVCRHAVHDNGTRFCFSQQGAVLLGELVEVLIAAVGDRGGEVGAVGHLEFQDRRGMAGMQPL